MAPQEFAGDIPDNFLDNLEEGLEIEQSMHEQDHNKQAFFLQTLLNLDSPSSSMPSDRSLPLSTSSAVATGPTPSPQAALSNSIYHAGLTHEELQARLERLYGHPPTNYNGPFRRGSLDSSNTSATNEPVGLFDRNNEHYLPNLMINQPPPTRQPPHIRLQDREYTQSTAPRSSAPYYGNSYGSGGSINHGSTDLPEYPSAHIAGGSQVLNAHSAPFLGGTYAGQYFPPQTAGTHGDQYYLPQQSYAAPCTVQTVAQSHAAEAVALPTKKRSKRKQSRKSRSKISGATDGKVEKVTKARNEGKLSHESVIKSEYKNMTPDEIFSNAESGEICGGALLHIAKSLNNWQIAEKLNVILDSKNKRRTSENNITKRITAALKKRDADAPTRQEINDSRKAKGVYKKQKPKQAKTNVTYEQHEAQQVQRGAVDQAQTQESEPQDSGHTTLTMPAERTLKRTALEAEFDTMENATSGRPIRRTRPRTQGAASARLSRPSDLQENEAGGDDRDGDVEMRQEILSEEEAEGYYRNLFK